MEFNGQKELEVQILQIVTQLLYFIVILQSF